MMYIPQTFQAWDNDGNPLSFGYLWTYKSGTDIPLPTFYLVSGTTFSENPWPIQLDVTGSINVYLSEDYAPYRFNVTDLNNVQMQDFPEDNILPGTIQFITANP